MDNIIRCQKRHLKQKVSHPSGATSGFKFVVL